MKYQNGEQVFVKRDIRKGQVCASEENGNRASVSLEMEEWAGKIVTIAYEEYGYYRIQEDEEENVWVDDMFDHGATLLKPIVENRIINELRALEEEEGHAFANVKLDNEDVIMCYCGKMDEYKREHLADLYKLAVKEVTGKQMSTFRIERPHGIPVLRASFVEGGFLDVVLPPK